MAECVSSSTLQFIIIPIFLLMLCCSPLKFVQLCLILCSWIEVLYSIYSINVYTSLHKQGITHSRQLLQRLFYQKYLYALWGIVIVLLEHIDHFVTLFHKYIKISYYTDIRLNALTTHYTQNYADIIGGWIQ